MSEIAVERAANDGALLAHGLLPERPILISLHSSARMKLLGTALGDLDPLAPEVTERITNAAKRILEVHTSQRDEIVITALDLD